MSAPVVPMDASFYHEAFELVERKRQAQLKTTLQNNAAMLPAPTKTTSSPISS
eukprot:CAMPEP_0116043370 /NCGR_PEP_ID=MMETSP0321-20121206/26317_1 /TAXON_ID=163516 /ORGANISM="Leptocylindrus danicus var. danicus, Strain B650" /LENGTH=52 /DNA_ID=CAMNT_0003524169 /DNA_START=108 /DNA_END=263 /DNA_ORIENTATION=+